MDTRGSLQYKFDDLHKHPHFKIVSFSLGKFFSGATVVGSTMVSTMRLPATTNNDHHIVDTTALTRRRTGSAQWTATPD